GFAQVRANASGGQDAALLFDSAGDDLFRGTSQFSFLAGNGYLNLVTGFASVNASASTGSDSADLFDSPGNDSFTSQGGDATLTAPGHTQAVHSFTSVRATSSAGGIDKLSVNAVNYLFTQVGNWR